ncbi:MAG: hypothetical protein LPK25_07600 [Cyclobacteriaceae bacterium]|nr:hypothetical protein [Cyclobacteriaceae bacterium]MDX5466531.1 hypothetical protein [Cyclobacteriaceae bacterium]
MAQKTRPGDLTEFRVGFVWLMVNFREELILESGFIHGQLTNAEMYTYVAWLTWWMIGLSIRKYTTFAYQKEIIE